MAVTLSSQEVAALTGKTERTVRRWAESGKIPAERVLNKFNSPEYLFSLDALEPHLQQKYFDGLKLTPSPEVAQTLTKEAKPLDTYSIEEQEEIAFWLRLVKQWQGYSTFTQLHKEELTMAETTTTTGTAPAAGGEGQTPQQTNPQPTAPTAEQRTAFQKFWDSLFGGKEEPAPGSGEGTKKDGDPASKEGEGTKQEPQDSKSYSEAELNAKIAEAKAAWEAEQQEKQRLAKLSPEERAKAEGEAQAQELTKLRTELLQRDLKDAAVKKLTDEGFPVGLADLLTYTDKESMEKSLQQTQEVFKSALEAAVKERLRGKTPEGLGGGAKVENTMKDQIAQSIRGGMM